MSPNSRPLLPRLAFYHSTSRAAAEPHQPKALAPLPQGAAYVHEAPGVIRAAAPATHGYTVYCPSSHGTGPTCNISSYHGLCRQPRQQAWTGRQPHTPTQHTRKPPGAAYKPSLRLACAFAWCSGVAASRRPCRTVNPAALAVPHRLTPAPAPKPPCTRLAVCESTVQLLCRVQLPSDPGSPNCCYQDPSAPARHLRHTCCARRLPVATSS